MPRPLQAYKWAELERWVANSKSEGVQAEEPSAPSDRLSEDELATVSKAASAFANVEGGVLVLGVVARATQKGELDRVQALAPLPNAEQVAGRLDERIAGITDPPIPGTQVAAIIDSAGGGAGVVAVYVPEASFSSPAMRCEF